MLRPPARRSSQIRREAARQEAARLHRFRQPAYDLVDGSIRFVPAHGGPEDQLWIKNAFAAKYYSYVTSSSGLPVTGAPGAPRTYGVVLGYRFGAYR